MRNNEKRLGAPSRPEDTSSAAAQQPSLAYVVPTEFVELPSRGNFYSEDHPFHNQETIEIKFMTAKDEDILSSETLIKKGLVLDRLFDNIIVDQSVDPGSLLLGDRNAIMVAARISSYGSGYDTKVACPTCLKVNDHAFDLRNSTLNEKCFDEKFLSESGVEFDKQTGRFNITLPVSDVRVELKLLTGQDELNLNDSEDSLVTSMLKMFVSAVNGDTDKSQIDQFIDCVPAADARHLRKVYSRLIPNIDMTQEFLCGFCGHAEDMEVPLTAEFFWPR